MSKNTDLSQRKLHKRRFSGIAVELQMSFFNCPWDYLDIDTTSCCKTSLSIEPMGLSIRVFISHWNFGDSSAAILPRQQYNSIAVEKLWPPILRLRELPTLYEKISWFLAILNKCITACLGQLLMARLLGNPTDRLPGSGESLAFARCRATCCIRPAAWIVTYHCINISQNDTILTI